MGEASAKVIKSDLMYIGSRSRVSYNDSCKNMCQWPYNLF